ncbi:hypothetical protein ACLM5J_18710 [Nocardioides sp. Bht2]|uniref:hypothetical protein n=1 Tax=Nocardioides sp. Bht2 TaxID=3392297 RepID=UPI0039B4D79A
MAENKKPRRLGGQAQGPRPIRRVAGQSPRPTEPGSEPAAEQSAGTLTDKSAEPKSAKAVKAAGTIAEGTAQPSILERRRTTVVLSSVLAVLAVLLIGLAITGLAGEPDEGDVKRWEPTIQAGKFTPPGAGVHPVTVSSVEWAGSVDEVANAISKIFTFSAKSIDGHLEAVQPLMTQRFIDEEYTATFNETADKVKANNADYQMQTQAQSVLSATSSKVTALIFVNQYVTKGTGKQAVTDLNPLRLFVTAIREKNAWKIDDIKAG